MLYVMSLMTFADVSPSPEPTTIFVLHKRNTDQGLHYVS